MILHLFACFWTSANVLFYPYKNNFKSVFSLGFTPSQHHAFYRAFHPLHLCPDVLPNLIVGHNLKHVDIWIIIIHHGHNYSYKYRFAWSRGNLYMVNRHRNIGKSFLNWKYNLRPSIKIWRSASCSCSLILPTVTRLVLGILSFSAPFSVSTISSKYSL